MIEQVREMNFRTCQLILIRKGRTLLTLWENLVLRNEPYIMRLKRSHGDFPRPMIQYINRNYDCTNELVGVEIGVANGDNAFSIMNILPIKKLYLIDPYSFSMYLREGYTESSQPAFDKVRDTAIELLSQFGDKIEHIIKKSEDAVDDVPDNLDFVYIDGNHEYEYVKKDLELYYPKVKVGGIFGGDNFESLLPDVARAVLEFTDKHGLKIHGGRSPLSYEWWVIKK